MYEVMLDYGFRVNRKDIFDSICNRVQNPSEIKLVFYDHIRYRVEISHNNEGELEKQLTDILHHCKRPWRIVYEKQSQHAVRSALKKNYLRRNCLGLLSSRIKT